MTEPSSLAIGFSPVRRASSSVGPLLDWRTGSTKLLVVRGLVLDQWRTKKHTMLGVVRGEYGHARDTLIVSRFLEHLRYRYRFTDWLAEETFVQHELDAFRRLRRGRWWERGRASRHGVRRRGPSSSAQR